MTSRKLDVTLPEEMIDAIENRVETGRYGSADDVMAAAIDALLREESTYDERISSIRRQIQHAIDDPAPNLSGTEMRTHMEKLYAKHRG